MNQTATFMGEIITSTAEAMFGQEPHFVTGARAAWPAGDNALLTACVTIGGAWNGAVSVACSRGFADHAAAAMFGEGEGDPSGDDARDALGELVNVLGGNFKSAMSSQAHEPCQLSLPMVADGLVTISGVVPAQRLWFRLEEHLLCVSVLEKGERAMRLTPGVTP
jgi:chemotaxis protein CheY-P-specific phosphatase CheC